MNILMDEQKLKSLRRVAEQRQEKAAGSNEGPSTSTPVPTDPVTSSSSSAAAQLRMSKPSTTQEEADIDENMPLADLPMYASRRGRSKSVSRTPADLHKDKSLASSVDAADKEKADKKSKKDKDGGKKDKKDKSENKEKKERGRSYIPKTPQADEKKCVPGTPLMDKKKLPGTPLGIPGTPRDRKTIPGTPRIDRKAIPGTPRGEKKYLPGTPVAVPGTPRDRKTIPGTPRTDRKTIPGTPRNDGKAIPGTPSGEKKNSVPQAQREEKKNETRSPPQPGPNVRVIKKAEAAAAPDRSAAGSESSVKQEGKGSGKGQAAVARTPDRLYMHVRFRRASSGGDTVFRCMPRAVAVSQSFAKQESKESGKGQAAAARAPDRSEPRAKIEPDGSKASDTGSAKSAPPRRRWASLQPPTQKKAQDAVTPGSRTDGPRQGQKREHSLPRVTKAPNTCDAVYSVNQERFLKSIASEPSFPSAAEDTDSPKAHSAKAEAEEKEPKKAKCAENSSWQDYGKSDWGEKKSWEDKQWKTDRWKAAESHHKRQHGQESTDDSWAQEKWVDESWTKENWSSGSSWRSKSSWAQRSKKRKIDRSWQSWSGGNSWNNGWKGSSYGQSSSSWQAPGNDWRASDHLSEPGTPRGYERRQSRTNGREYFQQKGYPLIEAYGSTERIEDARTGAQRMDEFLKGFKDQKEFTGHQFPQLPGGWIYVRLHDRVFFGNLEENYIQNSHPDPGTAASSTPVMPTPRASPSTPPQLLDGVPKTPQHPAFGVSAEQCSPMAATPVHSAPSSAVYMQGLATPVHSAPVYVPVGATPVHSAPGSAVHMPGVATPVHGAPGSAVYPPGFATPVQSVPGSAVYPPGFATPVQSVPGLSTPLHGVPTAVQAQDAALAASGLPTAAPVAGPPAPQPHPAPAPPIPSRKIIRPTVKKERLSVKQEQAVSEEYADAAAAAALAQQRQEQIQERHEQLLVNEAERLFAGYAAQQQRYPIYEAAEEGRGKVKQEKMERKAEVPARRWVVKEEIKEEPHEEISPVSGVAAAAVEEAEAPGQGATADDPAGQRQKDQEFQSRLQRLLDVVTSEDEES